MGCGGSLYSPRSPAIVFLWVLSTRQAYAEGAPAQISYQADEACPSERSFVDDVLARTKVKRNIAAASDARQFSVVIRKEGDRRTGNLTIRAPDGSVATREVTGENCVEVAFALALVTAVAIDLQASTRQAAPPTTATAVAPTSSDISPTPVVEPPPADRPRAAHIADTYVSRYWTWSVGSEGGALFGVVPVVAWGGGVFVDVARPAGWLGSIRAVGSYFTTASEIGPFDASFQWWIGRIELGVAHWRTQVKFDLWASIVLDAGILTAEATHLDHPEKKRLGWLSPGVFLRAGLQLRRDLVLETAVGATLPLAGWRLTATDANETVQTVHTIPHLGGTALFGVGYELP